MHDEDFRLAAACLRGDSTAIATFAVLLREVVAATASWMRLDAPISEELLQRLGTKLLAKKPPALSRYQPTHPLRTWLSRLCQNEAIDALRASSMKYKYLSRYQSESLVERLAQPSLTQEDAYRHAEYMRHFRTALQQAVQELSPEASNLLRWRHIDGLDLGQIAKLCGSQHRSTAMRKIEAVYAALTQSIRGYLAAQQLETPSILRSLEAVVASHLAEELSEVLNDTPPASS